MALRTQCSGRLSRPGVAYIVLLLLCRSIAAPVGAQCIPVELARIPVTMVGSTPMVKVEINGAAAFLIADSAASVSTLSRAIAGRLAVALSAEPSGYLRGIGGEATSQLAIADHLTVANLSLEHVRFLVSAAMPSKASGMLGQDILGRADTEYDLGHGLIRLVRPEGCGEGQAPDWYTGASVSTIRMAHGQPREPLATGVANLDGHELRVLFDTGAPHSMLTAAGARRAGISVDSNWSQSSLLLTGVGKSTSIGSLRYFETLKLGNEVRHHLRLYVTDIRVPQVDMVIGMDFFRSHRVYVATRLGLLYFVPIEDH
ncbi:MAG TPA: retroviral-like aspartic protease family protein [Steroidobacteraceae bacterium]|nr:retroviral-like aspartic protease family protein [Steroidobacteraceae bacterium]